MKSQKVLTLVMALATVAVVWPATYAVAATRQYFIAAEDVTWGSHRSSPGPTIEVGLASWYGHPYHGRRTSSGEVYDMHQLTAAHREIPLGSWVEVINLTNGRSLTVRVNDRGPFVDGRVIDLSYASAELLGVVGPGVVPIRVRLIQAPLQTPSPARYSVQVASFVAESNTLALEAELTQKVSRAQLVKALIPLLQDLLRSHRSSNSSTLRSACRRIALTLPSGSVPG